MVQALVQGLAGRPCAATPLLGKDLRTTFVELLYALDDP